MTAAATMAKRDTAAESHAKLVFKAKRKLFRVICQRFRKEALVVNVADLLLFEHHNSTTGRCDPGAMTLMVGAGLPVKEPKDVKTSRRLLWRAIAALEAGGFMKVVKNGGTMTRNGATNSYIPNLTGDTGVTSDAPVTSDTDDAGTGDTHVTQNTES